MASRPYFDKVSGWWVIKWKSAAGWRKERLCPHPGWTGDKPPKRPPPEAERIASRYRDMELRARHGEVATPTKHDLATYLESYVASAAGRVRPTTLRLVKRVVSVFLDFCQGRKIETVQAVSAAVCREFLTERQKTISAASVRTERGYLTPIWQVAVDDEIVPANPWAKAKLASAQKGVEHPPFWTREECRKLIAACPDWVRDWIIVGLNTGIRADALAHMERSWVHWDRRVIQIPARYSKSGRPYSVPISEACHDVLARREATRGDSEFLFRSQRTGGPASYSSTFRAIKAAAVKAGIPLHGHYNHILRHTFASLAIMEGVPLAVVSKWMGHSNIEMTMRYAHLSPEESLRHMATFEVRGDEKAPA